MIVDPTDTHSPPTSHTSLGPVAIAALALEAEPLSQLAEWPPVGALVQSLREALTGEGLSAREIQQLRAWAARWSALRPAVRAFYADHCTDPAVTHLLRRVLDGGPQPSPGAIGRAAALYRDAHGHDPPWPLFARVLLHK